MGVDAETRLIKSQRDSANKALSKLRSKMKELRNTHRTEFGPAIAYFEAFGFEDEADKLREAQTYNNDFIKGQEIAFTKLNEHFERQLKIEYNKRYPSDTNSGWAGPVSALQKAADAIEVFAKSHAIESIAVQQGVLYHVDQFLEIANSYKPWIGLGDLDEADYSFNSAKTYMYDSISELGPVSALEVWQDQKGDPQQSHNLKC